MADALVSGTSESNFMRVQVPSSAPEKKYLLSIIKVLLFYLDTAMLM